MKKANGQAPVEVAPPTSDVAEVTKAVEEYKRAHPEVDEALRVFEISNQTYQAAIEAMYGPHIVWSNSINPSKPQ